MVYHMMVNIHTYPLILIVIRYKKVVSGRLPNAPDEWTDPEGPVSFDDFITGMSLQFLQFGYRNAYPGEADFRANKKRHLEPTTAATGTHVSVSARKKQKKDEKQSHHSKAVVYTPYELLLTHVPERAFNCPRSCTLCGKNTYYACKTCKVASGRSTGKPLPLCFPSARKQSGSSSSTKIKEYNCHALYHLPESVGKGRCDCQTFEKMSTWDTTRDKRLKEIERAAMQKVAHYSRDEILKVL